MRSFPPAAIATCSLAVLLMHGTPFLAVAQAELSSQELDRLIETIILAESSGRPWLAGDQGRSRGLMQIQKANWQKYTSESWDRAFEPALNKAVGTSIVKDIAIKYGARANRALIVYTYNTGKFCKGELPDWTKRHPNDIYRGIFNER
jgi:hypothetical protein